METLKITSNELSQMQQLGRGACAVVYRYSTDLVIKALNEKGIELHNESEFSNMLGIENDTCVFPKSRVEIDGEFKGYTMDYVNGVPLHEVIKKIDISTIISAIQSVESDLKQLSSDKILFQDLNQGGIMWDSKNNRIRIIDTDFFEKNENIEEEQCYNANITSFNSMIEMELGIINGQGTKLSEYLQSNPDFSKLYAKYMIYSLNGKDMSITELIDSAVQIFESDFNVKVNSFEEMQKLIGERTDSRNNEIVNEFPTFDPPNEEEQSDNKWGIRQRIANFLADKKILRKIPFVDRFIAKEQRLLTKSTEQEQNKENKTAHNKFVDKISENGKHKNLFLGQPVKSIKIEPTLQKSTEPQSMADQNKIEQMKRKMDGKSMEDDL